MPTPKTRKRSPTLRLSQVEGYNDIKEELKSLNERLCDEVNKGHGLFLHIEAFEKRLRDIEGRMSSFLTIDDLRKVNVTMGLVEKDVQELQKRMEEQENESTKAWGMLGDHRGALADMKGKIADIASIIPSLLRDTDGLGRMVNTHDAQLEINFNDVRRTQGAHKERLDKLDERMNMAECDIEKLYDPRAFGPEPKQPLVRDDVVKVLQMAKQRVEAHDNPRAVSVVRAITFCTLPGDLRSRALLAMYLSVSCIWQLSAEAPTVFTDNVICQLLNEWNDGMVTCKADVLLAFDMAIRKESLRV